MPKDGKQTGDEEHSRSQESSVGGLLLWAAFPSSSSYVLYVAQYKSTDMYIQSSLALQSNTCSRLLLLVSDSVLFLCRYYNWQVGWSV